MNKQIKNKRQTVSAALIFTLLILVWSVGCSSKSASSPNALSPAQTVEQSLRFIEQDNFDDYLKLLSAKYVADLKTNFPLDKFKENGLPGMSKIIKGFGGIKTIEILKEDVSGDKAEVTYNIQYGSGMVVKNKQSLAKEDIWKLDGNSEIVQ